jgi:hypothetical protein
MLHKQLSGMNVRLVVNVRLDTVVPLTKRDAIREFEVPKSPKPPKTHTSYHRH